MPIDMYVIRPQTDRHMHVAVLPLRSPTDNNKRKG